MNNVTYEKVINEASKIISQKNGGENDGYCTLALIDVDGYPTTTTISISKSEGIRWITFCTSLESKKDRINHSKKASVCINSNSYHISLVGDIEVLTDSKTKKEMWYDGLKHHFKGYEDPDYCVLKFNTKRYNLFVNWDFAKGILK